MPPFDALAKRVVAEYIVSKLVIDEPEVPEYIYEKVVPAAKSVDRIASQFRGVSFDDPYTWYSSSKNLLSHFLDLPDGNDNIVDAIDIENLVVMEWGVEVIRFLLEEVPSEPYMRVDDGDERDVHKVKDVKFFYTASKEIDQYFCRFTHLYSDLEKMSDYFWEGKNFPIKMLEKDEDGTLDFVQFENDRGDFVGEERKYIDEVKKFYKKGIPRTILFQGEPGTGKTTLAQNIMEEVGDRVVFMGHNYIEGISPDYLDLVISGLSPDVVVIDDIDRTDMEIEILNELRDVPIVIMTSNYAERLPKAFLRPGRIDQIIEMESPSDDAKDKMIDFFAEDVGVEVEDYEQYYPMIEEHPPVFLKEFLKRKKALGDDYDIPEEDMTFRDIGVEARFNDGFGGGVKETMRRVKEFRDQSEPEIEYKND